MAFGINSRGQIVGSSRLADCLTQHAALWEEGTVYDLNDLIPADSGFVLRGTSFINDAGVIAGNGLPPGCTNVDVCGHAYLLFPCNEDGQERCENQSFADELRAVPLQFQTSAATRDGESRLKQPNYVGKRLRQFQHLPGRANESQD
jgi:probable HAF family extracellular repeat protein